MLLQTLLIFQRPNFADCFSKVTWKISLQFFMGFVKPFDSHTYPIRFIYNLSQVKSSFACFHGYTSAQPQYIQLCRTRHRHPRGIMRIIIMHTQLAFYDLSCSRISWLAIQLYHMPVAVQYASTKNKFFLSVCGNA